MPTDPPPDGDAEQNMKHSDKPYKVLLQMNWFLNINKIGFYTTRFRPCTEFIIFIPAGFGMMFSKSATNDFVSLHRTKMYGYVTGYGGAVMISVFVQSTSFTEKIALYYQKKNFH